MRKPDVPVSALRAVLEPKFGPIAAFTGLAEGEESRALGFKSAHEAYVVRLNRSAAGFAKDALAHRHFAHATLPIPEVLTLGRLANGIAYCVTRRMAGRTLQALNTAALAPLLAPVARVLDEIAATNVAGLQGYGPFDAQGRGSDATWRAYLTAVADSDRYDWSVVREADRIARIVDRLCALAEHCPEQRALVHGDFGSNNVLAVHGRITGVLDWDEALIGDPLYDRANIFFWRPWLDCMAQQAQFFEQLPGEDPTEPVRLTCYQLRIGLEEVFRNGRDGNVRMAAWALSRCEAIALG